MLVDVELCLNPGGLHLSINFLASHCEAVNMEIDTKNVLTAKLHYFFLIVKLFIKRILVLQKENITNQQSIQSSRESLVT